MVEKDDWRLRGQDFLIGKKLYYRKWRSKKPQWDHEHCEFCWEKFMETNPETLHYGYTTEDNRHWICQDCYEDFKDMFQWILVEEMD